MNWNRKLIKLPPAPKKTNFTKWFVSLIIVFVFSSLILYFENKYNYLEVFYINPWVVIAFPVSVLFFCFLIIIFKFMNENSKHNFLIIEKTLSDEQWESWGDRGLGVLAHYTLLPDRVTASFVVSENSDDYESFNGLVRKIDYINENVFESYLSFLLGLSKSTLSEIKSDTLIDVFIFTDNNDSKTAASIFEKAWETISDNSLKLSSVSVFDQFNSDTMGSWLSDGGESLKLILVEQVNGGDEYSDGLSIFLMATDDVCEKFKLDCIGEIKRPCLLPANFTDKELDGFFETQKVSNICESIIISDVKTHSVVPELLTYSFANNMKLSTEYLYVLEQFMGLTGPFSTWFAVGFALDIAVSSDQPRVLLARQPEGVLIGTITTWKNND